jgi:ATP-dependent Clp protease, protease subunit
VTAQERQASQMLSELASRLAAVTRREVEQIRSDLEHQRMLTVDEAIDYGLIERRAEPRRPVQTGLQPGPHD